MNKMISGFCFLIICVNSYTQRHDSIPKVYAIYPWIDFSIIVGGAITNYYGLPAVKNKPPLDSLTVVNLGPNDVNWFDRCAIKQNTNYAQTAKGISDYGMNISLCLPALLFLDKRIRNEWVEVLVLYLEAQSISGNLYAYGAARFVDRARPIVYYPEIPLQTRTGYNTMNSFFSGHSATSAVSSFFMAKVYVDFHPELGKKKLLIYSLAVIPPAFTGLYRIKGLKHFPTDVIAGMIVGAGVGIFIPHWHKTKHNKNLAILPFSGQSNGIYLTLKF